MTVTALIHCEHPGCDAKFECAFEPDPEDDLDNVSRRLDAAGWLGLLPGPYFLCPIHGGDQT